MKSEAVVQSEIRAVAGAHGIHLWRNNRGAMEDQTGRIVRFGLGNDSPQVDRRLKSSDLIGVAQVGSLGKLLPPGDQGGVGRFLAVECKAEGWKFPDAWRDTKPTTIEALAQVTGISDEKARTLAQWRFLTIVHKAGGLAGFAQSVDDFNRILKGELVLP